MPRPVKMNSTRSIEAKYNLDPQTLEEIMTVSLTKKPIIKKDENVTSHKTGTLWQTSKEEIIQALGFEPNVMDDPFKVENSWGFTVNGNPCGIWDWKGSHLGHRPYWSVYDPKGVLSEVFGDRIVEGY